MQVYSVTLLVLARISKLITDNNGRKMSAVEMLAYPIKIVALLRASTFRTLLSLIIVSERLFKVLKFRILYQGTFRNEN